MTNVMDKTIAEYWVWVMKDKLENQKLLKSYVINKLLVLQMISIM